MLKEALKKAKKDEEKKVSINFQVPSSLKEEFDKLCRENEVSLTAMLNSLMEVSLDESKGLANNDLNYAKKLLQNAKQLIFKYVSTEEDLERELSFMHDAPQKIVDKFMETQQLQSQLYDEITEFLRKEN